MVSCGATNSAALLLASANAAHPHGIANGSGQLGRNYMFHNSQAVLALSKDENPTVFQKTLGINDFYFGSDEFQYPLGNIQMVGKSSADMYRGEKPLQTKLAPGWALRDVARHAIDFWLSTEDLPRHENRVTLRHDGSIQLAYTADQPASPRSGSCTSSRALLGRARARASTTCCRTTRTCATTSRSRAWRTRPARASSGASRRRRC